ncbi:hypothetical protein E2C01_086079 [Portunus trituberculatus]|uniref:Uncharacterized protein n=1 Tax=Portunus trituberculatus TaxID=210409 RepID=A0A5B7JAK3_PORTR|nr:hypothetical protein [Portunus trituberculatus]
MDAVLGGAACNSTRSHHIQARRPHYDGGLCVVIARRRTRAPPVGRRRREARHEHQSVCEAVSADTVMA